MTPSPGEAGTETQDVHVGPLDLAARVDEALAVQTEAFGLSPEEVNVRRHIVLRHLATPGARALGATLPATGELVGFVYGQPNDRGQWWSSVVEPYLRRTGNESWLDGSFTITELHVLPAHQHRGIGRRLITTITDQVSEPRSILSAIDTDSPARALYHQLGYQDLARRVVFPAAPRPYAVMGAPLPLLRP
ncbi:GNAT family N-acetyltransferase [Streptomyces sp. DSM 44915]|uniref:GNAT family N-acetyltransferase n=1 Tax=Streptomyces chisholmiae TaxID=3075540 RepID=A0ABU2JX17_9ACTN|nr:GNAT family N-acetyltransferase [Streptomyces sp. DSM 44915]MDT0269293.1 GNAT family N-acetyltransferase [Streptomyces sp. DSM 44915]